MSETFTIEDADPFVMAVERAVPENMRARKPGLVRFFLDDGKGFKVCVERSRFDGDFGNICRITRLEPAAMPNPMALAPTDLVTEALESDSACDRLSELYNALKTEA